MPPAITYIKLKHPTHGNNKGSPVHLVLSEAAPSTYTAGDRVQGVARVEPTSRPQRIKLIFKGRSLIGINKRNDGGVAFSGEPFLSGEPEFFFYSQELYSSPIPEPSFDIVKIGPATDGRVEIPFEFTFPRNVELPPPPPIEMWEGRPEFEHSPGYPLPPSFITPPSTSMKQSIDYYLQAELFSGSAEKPDVMVRQKLEYQMAAPAPALLGAEPRDDTKPKQAYYKFIKTHKLSPDYDAAGVLKKVKHSLSKHEAPYTKFNVYAQVPPVFVVGCNLPISIALEHLDHSEELVDPPAIFLRRIRVQLHSTLHIRVRAPQHGLRGGEALDGRYDKIDLFDKRFESGNGELLYNGLQLADLGAARLTKSIVPSFKSYGLSLAYRLTVEIWGECAKEKFEGFGFNGGVQIVSNITTVEDAELVAFAASQAAVPPPPYQG